MWLGRTAHEISEDIGSSSDRVIIAAFGNTYGVDKNRVRDYYRKSITHVATEENDATKLARKMGWSGPGAWDDIDNPSTTPEITVHPLTTPQEMMEDVKDRGGWTNNKISQEFNVSRGVVRQTLGGLKNRLYSNRYNDTREAYLRALKEI